MAAKNAKPDRYLVDKIGIGDPEPSEFYVLNITQDADAREAMAYLGRRYQQHRKDQLSRECFDLLDATLPAFAAVMEARQPKKKSGGKKENARP